MNNLQLSYPSADAMLRRMRPHGDTTPDDQLKRKWLHSLSPVDRARLIAVFDDRQKVVDMWRSEGVPCFQVAPGDF
ncbi:PseT-like polynucleotide kinase phosphatase [Burkholderia phage vB_BglM_WTB]